MGVDKLKIESFKTAACTGASINDIDMMVNPENYSRDYKINYENPSIIGDSANTSFFASVGSNQLSLKGLLVDGTGVIPGVIPGQKPYYGHDGVDAYIKHFSKVVYFYSGTIHRPPFLRVTWGNLKFKGVCSSFKVDYKLFKPDGTALRAVIELVLTESKDFKTKISEAENTSADLTHKRIVKAGDTLPLLSYQIYGDSAHYIELAKHNKLTSLSFLKPGDEIYFPPLKK